MGEKERFEGKDAKDYVKKEQLLTFNVMALSAYGFSHVKEINLPKIMKAYLEEHRFTLPTDMCGAEGKGRLSKQQKETAAKNEKITKMQAWIEESKFEALTDEHFSFSINDALDVCIQIRQSVKTKA